MRSLIWVAIILVAVANGGDGNAQGAGSFEESGQMIVTCPRRREPGALPFWSMLMSKAEFSAARKVTRVNRAGTR